MATSFMQLSDRELEVLEFMGLGKSSKQIGEALNLSVKTIHTYQQRLKAKLGLVNMTELLQYATHWTSDLANNRTPV